MTWPDDTDPERGPWLNDLPSVEAIIDMAFTALSFTNRSKLRSMLPHQVAAALERKCHEIYNSFEEKIREKFQRGEYGKYSERDFETSLANSRRARAGRTLELIFRRMLGLFEIQSEAPSGLGEAEFDFVVPDMETLRKNPQKAVLISLKREVRERWKLTVGDAYILRKIYGYPDNLWFVSLFDPPVDAVRVFLKLDIRVYVPDASYQRIRDNLKDMSDKELEGLRKFSHIFDDLRPFTKALQRKLV